MKKIADGPTAKFNFSVLLTQKQCINFVISNI